MTTRDLLDAAGQHSLALAAAFVVPPVAAFLVGRMDRPGEPVAAWRRSFYAALVYVACVPGMFAAVFTGYALFFTSENLLDVNPIVYFLPIVSMVATLLLIRKAVSFEQVPGFDRLSGLMVMVGCSFVIALAIQKTRIWLVFGSSIERLLVIAAAVFALLKWGAYALFRRKDDPIVQPPRFSP